ncbi:putative lipoprotein with Yx(FWY)xxD motif [Saccharothrix tamanrassetensis]|uniref:Putative lipoprotein with Yx(FWY)xxD motif n=1 Tax=Saccharothrix tamanrassetensis TaxID=1051531 RepID=A0A841CFC8_9PSEU|nr:hypothetical protein [Saccharothrix tamanrassetensis]MBB5956021.1 putative lipoprotein with Yx(FWY)xxD motif [Saccharothrix tamanrassetensis]
MTRTRAAVLGTAALIGIALLGACGEATQAGAPHPTAQEARIVVAEQETPDAAAADGPALATAVVSGLGTVLTDGEGLTLYRFDKDTANPSLSTCDGDCAAKWPPALATSADVEVQGVDKVLVGTVQRDDGTKQLTVGGWPVYRFAQDAAPGEAKGQGVGGTWFVAAPDGKKAAKAATGLALTTASVGDLGTVLTDKDGMTLYRFDKDTANPSLSNCNGDCAVKWPPLVAESDDFAVQGVDRTLVGTVLRADGRKQVTVAGWPLYLFADDKVCGEAKGQGVGGVWFAAKPDGRKAGV